MKSRRFDWIRSGNPWVWLSASAVSISLISVLGLLLLIGWKGLVYFWPTPIYQWQDEAGAVLLGQVYQRDYIPLDQISEQVDGQDRQFPQGVIDEGRVERLSIKVANRDIYPQDFISVLAIDLHNQTQPKNVAVFERTRGGDFFGTPVSIINSAQVKGSQLDLSSTDVVDRERVDPLLVKQIQQALTSADKIRQQIEVIMQGEMHQTTLELEQLNRQIELLHKQGYFSTAHELNVNHRKEPVLTEQKVNLQTRFNQLEKKIRNLQNQLNQQTIIVEDMRGERIALPMDTVLDAWYPNNMTGAEKAWHWVLQVKKFLTDDPRESNSEGGVFPAIFGTVLLVILMSIVVMPLGVIAAIYLHEYAKNTVMTKLIRIAVVNLAGVPSIVYGVFGLGFFVYTIGSSIDELFYSSSLPTPTFGTPGLLWSALTLAILTLPVVIVATEEGLARVPSSVRHGSYALGATKFETLWRIILPMVSPAIMTGLILAVARAAGEVAPLMLVGVVKLAPSLPIDGYFPYIHLERKFMHLGFHIYDVGFQTPNIEAARPLVFATSFLLITVVVGLNITAILIRNNLREKFRTLGND